MAAEALVWIMLELSIVVFSSASHGVPWQMAANGSRIKSLGGSDDQSTLSMACSKDIIEGGGQCFGNQGVASLENPASLRTSPGSRI